MNFEGIAIKCVTKNEMSVIYGIACASCVSVDVATIDARIKEQTGDIVFYFRKGEKGHSFYSDPGKNARVAYKDFISMSYAVARAVIQITERAKEMGVVANKPSRFDGLAIKCNSDEEVQEIYKMALAEGLLTHPVLTGERVAGKPLYFRCSPTGFHDESGKDKVVKFQDFIAAHRKTNPFENVAVECNTFDEIKDLAKIAEGMGLDVGRISDTDCWYFRHSPSQGYYSNWSNAGEMPVIPYADFVASLQPTPDPVNRPAHYTSGKIEVIDFIEDQQLGLHLGNVVKYVARAGKKDPSKEVQDLEKARWYLDRKIKQLKNKQK